MDRLIAEGRPDEAVAVFAGAANGADDQLADAEEQGREVLREAVWSAGREIRAASGVLPFRAAQLDAVRVPCLVLLGDQQDLSTYDGVHELADRLPDGRLGRVPGGHLAPLFEPDAVARQLETFFAGTTSAM